MLFSHMVWFDKTPTGMAGPVVLFGNILMTIELEMLPFVCCIGSSEVKSMFGGETTENIKMNKFKYYVIYLEQIQFV